MGASCNIPSPNVKRILNPLQAIAGSQDDYASTHIERTQIEVREAAPMSLRVNYQVSRHRVRYSGNLKIGQLIGREYPSPIAEDQLAG